MSNAPSILILNGPNLNCLGRRDPALYGVETLDEIKGLCVERAEQKGWRVDFRQTNHEGTLVDWVQEALNDTFSALVINAAAYTHSSIALYDALEMLDIPVIEVHLSNPKERESFRHTSYVEPHAAAVISGHGAAGYGLALDKLTELLDK